MKYVILIIILYYVGRFFIRFILPVVKLSYAANKQFKQMRNNENGEGSNPYYQQPQQAAPKNNPRNDKRGDYIDYVEIK